MKVQGTTISSSPFLHRIKEHGISILIRSDLRRAQCRLEGSTSSRTSDDIVKDHRDALVLALQRLGNFSVQAPHIVCNVVDLVSSFIKDPRLFRTKLMNYVLMGGAGTGKTTIAETIGDVFAKAGIFVGNNLILAGRGELVGQYMGETVTKTRQFLTNNLDNGVIFIDEVARSRHGKTANRNPTARSGHRMSTHDAYPACIAS